MKKLQYAVARKETGNASGKAKKDAFDIALRMGFEPSYQPASRQGLRVIQQVASLPRFMGDKVIFFQYPAVSEQLTRLFNAVTSKRAYTIALIHDLISIQGLVDYDRAREGSLLRPFDCLIVLNVRMEAYVRELGYRGSTVQLELFDYLHDASRPVCSDAFSNSVVFAGNLAKAGFLRGLDGIGGCRWLLYGMKGSEDFAGKPNVRYKGLLPSDEIQYLMEGDYGLVWDGESVETCAGPTGEYLRYNCPHKLSLCVAAGKPVIIWRQAAAADFVIRNRIGIAVDSLTELNGMDLSAGYDEMKQNVMRLKRDVAEGRFLERALLRAMAIREAKR